ncbi:MAG: sensor histidine kinase [Pseudomonadota bacterium]
MPYVRATSRRKARRFGEHRFAVAWHAVFGVAALIGAAGAAWATDGFSSLGAESAPLAAVAAAGLLLAGLGATGRTVAVVLWAAAAAVACAMTGGTAGPLAALCLAPMGAAASFRKRAFLALGAAASVAAAAAAALAGALADLPQPSPELSPWLSLFAIAATVVGLAAGLIGLQGAQAREARRQLDVELELREILDHQPQLLLTLSPAGRILNAFGPPLLGGEPRRLRDRQLTDLVALDYTVAVDEALQAAARDGSAEVSFAPAHDAEGWLELSLTRLGASRIGAAVRDARAQRAREAELDRARQSAEQQNAGKSRFLANMSHELRTPLNAIMGFSDIMRQRLFGPLADRYAEYAELIHESGSHLLELINDVLDMSKIEAERFELAREDFDVRDAITAVVRLMRGQAERAGVALRTVLPPEALEIDADRRALKQITLNLVSNALKFTPRGGSVTVTAQASGGGLELIVADTGMGIAPADLERLGRPFEQAGDAEQRKSGSGLGLSLVRAFATLHGGEMSIESTVGGGTAVTVRMPVLIPQDEAPPAPAVSEA